MGLDIGEAHGWIVAEVARRRPVAESMAALIDQCKAAHPHPDWNRLRALPDADLSPLLEWVREPFREEPPDVPLEGLWFGRFNPCPNDNDWAVGPDWWPEARYANSAVLAEIYRNVYSQGAPVAEQQGCLGNGWPV